MASKTQEAKVKFTAETGEFNNQIKKANSTLSELRSELKLNSAQMKTAGESVDMLANRQKILAQESEASRAKIAALEAKLNTAKSIFGENSIEVQKLATQLNNARTAEERIQANIQQCSTAMQKQASAARESESAIGKLESTISTQESELSRLKNAYSNLVVEYGQNSSEAKTLASRITALSGDLSTNRQRLDEAKNAANELDRAFDKAGDSARDMGSDLGNITLGNLAADGIQGAISSLTGLEEATRQYRNEQAKITTVAQQSWQDVNKLRDSYTKLYGITADETLSSTAVLNMSAMGLSVEQQESLINSAAGAWAQYGDSIPLDGMMESVTESSKLGATLTGPVVDAFNRAHMSAEQWSASLSGNSKAQAAFNKSISEGATVEDAMNAALAACSTEQERQQLLVGALDAAYGSMGTAYRETNADVIAANEATAAMTQAQAELSTAIAPVTTAITNLAAGALSWLADNLNIVGPIVAGASVAFGGLWLVLGGGATIINTVKTAFTLLNVAMAANPVGIVIALIAGLVTAFLLLWNNCEGFRNFWIGLWENGIKPVVDGVVQWFTGTALPAIQGFIDGIVQFFTGTALPAVQGFVNGVVQFFTGLWTNLQNIWNGICNVVNVAIMFLGQIFNLGLQILLVPWNFIWQNFGTTITAAWNLISGIVQTGINLVYTIISTYLNYVFTFWSTIWNAISTAASTVWSVIVSIVTTYINYVQTVISNIMSVISGIWSSVWNAISSTASAIWSVIVSVVTTYINYVQSVISSVLSVISGVWSSIWNAVSSVASSVWSGISSTISSILNGIKNTISSVLNAALSVVQGIFNSIKSAIETPINAAKDAVSNAINAIKNAFNFSWSLPPLKLPHLSISGSFSINPPSVPSFGISWYAEGGILNAPTIFGAAGGKLLGGGEAGPEAVLPIDKLEGYIENVMERNENNSGFYRLAEAVEGLAERVISIEINGKQLMTAVASDADRVSGSRQNLANRRLSLR